jgi:chemotaxis protein MotB
MSISSPRHFASLSIEEPVQQPNLQQQNWLLTYVDVFILIIMLVITLIALNDIESENKQQNTQVQINKQKKPKNPKLLHPVQKIPSKKHESLIAPVMKPIPPQPSTATDKTAIQQPPQDDKPATEKKLVSIKKEPPTQAQLNKNALQQKFTNTLSELGLVDSVQMKVTLGYAQLEIQDKILFNSSEAVLVNSGENLLKKLTTLLKQSTGLIYIEGHTDDRPIKTAKFPSNWELGAARATSVLHYLASQKLDATRLRAITYGSTKPLADNSTEEGREKNRRVSLVIKISDKID